MEALLNFAAPLNVELLDQVVKVMHYGQEPLRSQADKVLTQYREHPESWRHADKIIDAASVCLESKFFALQLLEGVIRYRWRSLPIEQRETIKAYLTKYIIAVGAWGAPPPRPPPPLPSPRISYTRFARTALHARAAVLQ